MMLGIAMLAAYIPFLFWVIPTARADMKAASEENERKLRRY